MSDNSFEYITTDYMVSVNPIEDTQSPTVEYIVELGQQGLPGAKGEPGEPGFSPVVTSVIDDNTIRFTLVNKDEVTTTPNFYDLLAKKDLSNTTYEQDMANKLDKNGANADSPITLNKLIITAGTTMVADVLLSTTHNNNININAPIRTINNIQLSPSGTTGRVTYKGNELATLNDIPEIPDVSNFLNKDGSNAASNFTINGTTIDSNGRIIGNTGGALLLRDNGGNTNVSINSNGVSIVNYVGQSFTINSKEIATVDQIPTKTSDLDNDSDFITSSDLPSVGNGLITIKQGDVTKGTFTTNQSGNTTIELDEGGGSGSYTEGNGIDITNNVISIDNTVALKTDIPDVSNFVTNTSLATTLASYVTTGTLVNTLSLYARKDQLEAVAFSGDYDDLLNKPTIGNGTITFTQGGVTKGSITLNQSSNQTIALDAGGGGGGVTNPIALSETIGGNTYNLNIGIDKTTGNLQGTYSYPVSGGTDTLSLFSRSYGLVNAGLSNNYTTVNGYHTNQLSVKVDNSTIGFNSNGALTVTGDYASATDLDGKVSKSGDTMTGTLNIANQGYLAFQHDELTKGTIPSATTYQEILFEDSSNADTWQEKRLGFIQGKQYKDGRSSIVMGAVQNVANSGNSAIIESWINQDGTTHCTFPNTECVDSKVYATTKTLLENGNLSAAEHSYSLSSYLPNDGKIYEIFLEIRGRTGAASGNYALIYVNGGITGCNIVYTVTRTSSYQTFVGYGSVYVNSARNLGIKLTGNTTTATTIVIRGYRRIGTNS